ncbi:MAG TPA: polysaccharide biosynthesis tyrosine autokinase, partial [Bryobacteraceae bacterium]|nr:polysaccharide biosynthesis tyrosine autokinase [Bryobacteraceae bacterium]
LSPEGSPAAIVPLSAAALSAPVPPPVAPDDVAHAGLPFSHYTWLLRTHFTKMLAFVMLTVIATVLVTLRLTPIYESTATLYVDRAAQKDIVGKESEPSQASNADADEFLSSQIRLMQSDSVVRPLAEKYHLLEREAQVRPGKDDPARIARIKAAPIVLKGLRITRPPNTYILQISYRSSDPEVATAVANGIASSYIDHIYNIRFHSSESLSRFLSRQQDELRAKMEASAARLAALEKELNVINPEEKTNILSARLLELNTEYTKVQAARVQAQSAYNSLVSGSLEAALSSTQSEELRGIIKRLNEEQQRFADIKTRYGPNHPEYARLQGSVTELQSQIKSTVQLLAKQAAVEFQRAQNQEALLKKDVDDTKAQYDQLNLRSFEYQRAKQEAEGDRNLYEELVKKIREGQINAGFQNDMVRVADPARPGSKPVSPSIPLNTAIALMLSSLMAVATVILSDRIDTTIKNPDEVSRGLNARVIGVLPALKKGSMASLPGYATMRIGGAGENRNHHASAFDEAVRTIRNSILLTDFDRNLRSILITSATPAEGKSTVIAHLARSHAEQHHRTLLIDGDMWRPSLHRLFRIPNTTGLSKVLDRELSWRDALVQPDPGVELYVLPAGPATRRSADLVGQRLPELLEEAAGEFDLIFLDAPPLLGFPEPLQMAASTDGVIIVARAGQTDRTAVAAVLDTLHQLRANTVGLILNEVRKNTSSSYHYYGANYGKYYARSADDGTPAS